MAMDHFDNHPTNFETKEVVRPLANFSPSIWGDFFHSYTTDNQIVETYESEVEVLKEKVRLMLSSNQQQVDSLAEKLNLIDIIERLGLSYHFSHEIEEQLEKIFNNQHNIEKCDLSAVSLQFRLLRQHGFTVFSDIFNEFKDVNGFNETLKNDVKGMLNLYEATHTKIHGEDILEEALNFSTQHLEKIAATSSSSSLIKHVRHALEYPVHKGIPRVEVRHFISFYEEDESKNELVLRLAKLDYNFLQLLHRKELCDVSRWWKELDMMTKLPYARDRVVECYFWTLGVYYEPRYSLARIMLTKTIAMISIIDDTYDSYGSVEELKLFTDAVQRWDIGEIDSLPEYMKELYKSLLDLYKDYDEELTKLGRSYAASHAKERMKEICKSYYIEAKWFIEGYTPRFEEYLSNALITSTYFLLTTTALLGMESATSEDYHWIMSNPKIMMANVTICRVVDDIATYEIEKKRGQITTGIDCFIKQYGVSKEEAMNACNEIVENAWMDMNEGCLRPWSTSAEVLARVFNLVRIIDAVYKHNEDGYTNPEKVLKPHVLALLVDPINL